MSIHIQTMVNSIVDWYADRENGLLTLDVANIPESDLNNLSATMIAADDMLAAEATGPDNQEWYGSMLPALIRTMQSQKTGYSTEEFHDVWTSSVRNYLMPRIEKLIAKRLEELNEDTECHMSLIWDRAKEKVIEMQNLWCGLEKR